MPVPAADGVNVAVATVEPVGLTVVELNAPASVDVSVITSPVGHVPPVGVNETVTAAVCTADAADNVVV